MYGADRGFAYVLGSAFIETDRVDHGQRLIETHLQERRQRRGPPAHGTVHLRAGDAPAALIELRKAVELNPLLPVANGLLGRALLRNGEHEAALRAFRRELEINPDDFNANLQVSELKKRDQQFDEAKVYIERALRMRPDDVAGALRAGWRPRLDRARTKRRCSCSRPSSRPSRSIRKPARKLAPVYYRLNRKADGDWMRARVQELNAEAQARQPTAQPPASPPPRLPAARRSRLAL